MPDNPTGGKVDVVFNKTLVRTAQNQHMLRSWLSGLSDQYPGQSKGDGQIEQEERGIFTIEPEIAGLGIPAQSLTEGEISSLDPFTRSEDTSTAFLRQQLIGKKGKDPKPSTIQRSTINLPGLEAGFQLARGKAADSATDPASVPGHNRTQQDDPEASEDANLDDEDEVGRSGLGKAKTKSRTAVVSMNGIDNAGSAHPAAEGDEEDLAESENKMVTAPRIGLKRKQSSARPKARSYLDEILAQKEAKKQRKKAKGQSG